MGKKSIEMANLNNLSTYLDTFQQQLKESHYNNLPKELIIQLVDHKRKQQQPRVTGKIGNFVLDLDSDTYETVTCSTCDTFSPPSPRTSDGYKSV